jgi:hypothetical protein
MFSEEILWASSCTITLEDISPDAAGSHEVVCLGLKPECFLLFEQSILVLVSGL